MIAVEDTRDARKRETKENSVFGWSSAAEKLKGGKLKEDLHTVYNATLSHWQERRKFVVKERIEQSTAFLTSVRR